MPAACCWSKPATTRTRCGRSRRCCDRRQGPPWCGRRRRRLDLTRAADSTLPPPRMPRRLCCCAPPAATGTSAAATRWRIASAAAARDRTAPSRTRAGGRALERCRNGRTGKWLIEWDHVAHRFRLVEGVADRAPVARACRPQARRLTCASARSRRPLVLVAPGKGGARIAALNRAAQRAGLAQGELLSNARSKVLDLQARDPIPPPMPLPCAGWRSGACAIRLSSRPGTRRAAPMACSSTSPAARICSAARRVCWPISAAACAPSGLSRAGVADTPGPPGRWPVTAGRMASSLLRARRRGPCRLCRWPHFASARRLSCCCAVSAFAGSAR